MVNKLRFNSGIDDNDVTCHKEFDVTFGRPVDDVALFLSHTDPTILLNVSVCIDSLAFECSSAAILKLIVLTQDMTNLKLRVVGRGTSILRFSKKVPYTIS
jgi:hypothetical protein